MSAPISPGDLSAPSATGSVTTATSSAPDFLTDREREILQLVAESHSTKEIAAKLGISVKTVETHRARIMEALSCRNAVELLRVAVRLHDRVAPLGNGKLRS